MLGLGTWELLLLLLVVFLIYGPDRLPVLAKQIGRTFRDLRRTVNDVRNGWEKTDDAPS